MKKINQLCSFFKYTEIFMFQNKHQLLTAKTSSSKNNNNKNKLKIF